MSENFKNFNMRIKGFSENLSDVELKERITHCEFLAFDSMDIIISDFYKTMAKELSVLLEERKAKRKEVLHANLGKFIMTVKNDRFIIGGGNDIHVTDLKLAKSQLQKVIDKIDEFI